MSQARHLFLQARQPLATSACTTPENVLIRFQSHCDGSAQRCLCKHAQNPRHMHRDSVQTHTYAHCASADMHSMRKHAAASINIPSAAQARHAIAQAQSLVGF